ncbi:hypothetical protein K469DRAFT_345942 [Zopfia rhizophila CBS 207.26]|uniref:Uncharacterized protein n=1 Tax=Zopfia rhizophila CBS 207.26 TaxID=1314779 RepID=A0A6A6ELF0_9PEZI|nr:hypothetical protein K469DRAFT_345942 [Zopfia rhizophila CBS 207.26]
MTMQDSRLLKKTTYAISLYRREHGRCRREVFFCHGDRNLASCGAISAGEKPLVHGMRPVRDWRLLRMQEVKRNAVTLPSAHLYPSVMLRNTRALGCPEGSPMIEGQPAVSGGLTCCGGSRRRRVAGARRRRLVVAELNRLREDSNGFLINTTVITLFVSLPSLSFPPLLALSLCVSQGPLSFRFSLLFLCV